MRFAWWCVVSGERWFESRTGRQSDWSIGGKVVMALSLHHPHTQHQPHITTGGQSKAYSS